MVKVQAEILPWSEEAATARRNTESRMFAARAAPSGRIRTCRDAGLMRMRVRGFKLLLIMSSRLFGCSLCHSLMQESGGVRVCVTQT